MVSKASRLIYWTPRVLSILFITFLVLMSLDVFEAGGTVRDTVVGLFMHNIPALILLIVLIISWKYEIVGGIIFILAGLVYVVFVAVCQPWFIILSRSLQIAGPAFLVGILFMIHWFIKDKEQ